jgi:hypothetical protein
MGVNIIVNDVIVNSDTGSKTISFDETLNKIDYNVTDFRNYGMKWFFYDFGNPICEIHDIRYDANKPEKLVNGSKIMINEISNQIGITLPENPVDARSILKEKIMTNKNELQNISNKLNQMLFDNEIDSAWKLIRSLQSSFYKEKSKSDLQLVIEEIQNKIDHNDISGVWTYINKINKNDEDANNDILIIYSVINYVELAVFFYTVGKHGHDIEWRF